MLETSATSHHFRFTVRVPPNALRNAALFYMWRRFRWRYVAGWVGAGLGAAAYSMTDLALLTTVLGITTAALALALIIYPFIIWYAVRRTVEGYVNLTGAMPVEYELDEEWLSSRYATESGELHWSEFEEVLRTDDMLLLVTGEHFIPLPLHQVPAEALQFIERKIGAHDD